MKKTLAFVLALGGLLYLSPDAESVELTCQQDATIWAQHGPVPMPRGWTVTCGPAPRTGWAQYGGMTEWSTRSVWINSTWHSHLGAFITHEAVHAWQSKLSSRQLNQMSREVGLPVRSADNVNNALETHAAVVTKCLVGDAGPYQYNRMSCGRALAWLAVARKGVK